MIKKRLGNTLRGRCTFFLAQNKYNKEAKKNPRLTQYIWLAPAVARPIFAFAPLRQTSDILNVSLSKKEPLQVFELIKVAKFPGNLFLKHLVVLSDYGGEPIQKLGRSFIARI